MKNELQKQKIEKQEIEEIIRDHEEMINEALAEGLSETEIVDKFGEPERVAKDIADSNHVKDTQENKKFSMATAWKTIKVDSIISSAIISLLSEDITYETVNEDEITIYYDGNEDMSLYDVSFENGIFNFKRRQEFGRIFFKKHNSDMQFLVKFPKKIEIHEFKHSSVSGDITVKGIIGDTIGVSTTSGDISVNGIVTKTGKISSVSGDIVMNRCIVETLSINTVSGDMDVDNLAINEELRIDSVSGDVEINNTETKRTAFKTVSGDMQGSEFYPGEITFSSVSGDVDIRNQDQSKIIKVLKKSSVSGTIQINNIQRNKN